MTTPAVDENQLSFPPVYCIRLWSGEVESSGNVVSSVYKLSRPQSVSSPIRSDGTRAPRGWTSSGLSETLPIAETRWSEDPEGVYMRLWNGGLIPYVHCMYVNGISLDAPPRLWERADGRALDNAKHQKVDLSVALAEARTTARMVGQTAERIANMVQAFRRKNPKKVWESVKRGGRHMPSSYLEMSYGWSPLLQDVLGSAEALAEAQNLGRRFSIVVRGAASDTERFSQRSEWPGLYDLVHEGETKHRVEVVLRYDLPANMLDSLSSLGLTNPLTTVYELVPYSFVLDWILPVGDWLSRLDAGSYLSFIEGSRSVMSRVKSRSHYEDRNEFAWRYNKATKTLRRGMLRAHRFYRIELSSPPSNPLPSLRSPLLLDKMAKGLSLLATAFDRNPGKWGNSRLWR